MPAMLGSVTALAGDGIQVWKSGQLTVVSYRVVTSALAKEITWQMAGEIVLKYIARFNPWLIAATALIFAGELAHNYLHSTPLMRWISRCAWGKQGLWPGDDYQDWDYHTQLVHWLEVVQTPVLEIEAEPHQERVVSPSGNWTSVVEMHRVKLIRLSVPMVRPQQVRLAGYLKLKGQPAPVDITTENLKHHRVVSDGVRTVCEFNWPVDNGKYKNYQYLDLLVEVTTTQGDILFADQKGARFTINMQFPQDLEPVDDKQHRYQVEQLEASDAQRTPVALLVKSLAPLSETTS
jgi:hypothetical protein